LTTVILIVNVIVSAIALQNRDFMRRLIFNPYAIHQRNEWYRFFSSGFIHADVIHLAVNMYVLYWMGDIVEQYYSHLFGDRGVVYFTILYLSSLVMSIFPTYNNHKHDPGYNGLGASGAVSAVVFTFILLNPMQRLCLYGLEFLCLPGIIFGVLYLYYCYYMSKKGGDNINHSAHMWGAIYGFTFTLFLKPSLVVDFFTKLINFRDAI
jgi:membrane associated rhomboid family serine protease